MEGRLCLHDRIVKLWDEWDEWLEDKSGGADFEDLSNGEKMSILNKFDDFLDDLERMRQRTFADRIPALRRNLVGVHGHGHLRLQPRTGMWGVC